MLSTVEVYCIFMTLSTLKQATFLPAPKMRCALNENIQLMGNKVDSNCILVFKYEFDQSHQAVMTLNECTRIVVKFNIKNCTSYILLDIFHD